MQNIKDLRNSLLENYNNMKSGTMSIKVGKELANTAGKVLQSIKIEMEYNALINVKNNIEFMK